MSKHQKFDRQGYSPNEKDKKSLEELYQLKYDVVLDLYRRRARRLEAVAVKEHNAPLMDNWEYYLYKMFGSRFVGSLAFSLDPYWQAIDLSNPDFGVPKKILDTIAPQVVTPVNRHTKFVSILPSQTYFVETKKNHASSNSLLFEGGKFRASGVKDTVTTINAKLTPIPFQSQCYGWKHDTTWKTRNPGQKVSRRTLKNLKYSQGEFELFVPTIKATSQTYGYKAFQTRTSVVQAVGNPNPPTLITNEDDYWYGHTTGPTVTVLDATCQSYYGSEQIYARKVMSDHLDKMMAQTVPNRRYFNLGYQIGELKDVPFSIKSTLRSWRDCQRLMGNAAFYAAYRDKLWWQRRNIERYWPALRRLPNNLFGKSDFDKTGAELYLNFKFGWDSLFGAIKHMLTSPLKAANDINKIIARNGKFSNLAYQIGWSEPLSAIPSLNLPSSNTLILNIDDTNHPAGVTGTRDITLRAVSNTGINFPECDKPSFRMKLFLDKMGLVPNAADAYDLIPWTWLIDWFTGATDYIHLMNRVNGNRDLVNYSLITYKSITRVKGARQMYGLSTVGWKHVPPDLGTAPLHTETYTQWWDFSGELVLKYELRLSVASLLSVGTYSSPLNEDQKAILTSLFISYGL